MDSTGIPDDNAILATTRVSTPPLLSTPAVQPNKSAVREGTAGDSADTTVAPPGHRHSLVYADTPWQPPPSQTPHSGAIRAGPDFVAVDHRHHPYTVDMTPSYDFTRLYPSHATKSEGSPKLSGQHQSNMHLHSAIPLQENISEQYQQHVQVRKQRRTQACDWCHKKRIKCDGGKPCNNCIKRDVRCEWRTMKRRGPKPRVAKAELSSADGATYGKFTKKPSAADIANLLLDDEVVRTSRLYASSRTPSNPRMSSSGTDTSRHSPSSEDDMHTDGFVRPPIDDLLQEFYSDKVETETRDAVLAYFDYVYPSYGAVFHPSTFLRRIVANDVHPLLIEALKCVVAPYIALKKSAKLETGNLASELKAKILFSLEKPTTDIVLALLFLSMTESQVTRMDTYAVIISATTGLIMRLGYHKLDLYRNSDPKTWEEWIEVETKRRIFWSVFQHDSLMALVQGLPTMIPESSIFVKSPCADSDWNDIEFPLIYSTDGLMPVSERVLAAHGGCSKKMSSHESSPEQEIPISVVTGAVSHSFALLCEFSTLDSRICQFLSDAKAARIDQDNMELQNRPFPAVDFLEPVADSGQLVYPVRRMAKLVSGYSMFHQFDAQLRDLRERIKPPKHITGLMFSESDMQQFGSADYRASVMRVRYVVITAYTCSSTIILHSNNRPSFFAEFDQPVEEQADPKSVALRQVMSTMFGTVWSQGLLATDIVPESWYICVQSAHTLAEFLRDNDDIPSIRFDVMVYISIIINASVLLRQIRCCRAALKEADDSEMPLSQWQQELDRSIRNIRSMWDALVRLSEAWNLEGATDVLKMMDTDDFISATE
ncbi:hypothetical protein EC988_001911, partial [Linderina pennispora]